MSNFSLIEYGLPQSLSVLATTAGVSPADLAFRLTGLGRRITETLGIRNAVQLDRSTVRLVDVAGLVRLSPTIEMEIVPKFLSSQDEDWREDFFCVANLSRYGRLLPREALLGRRHADTNLADLIGRALVTLFDRARRKPLREYRRRVWTDYPLDGDAEPESIIFPETDGFVQSGLALAKDNAYNATIQHAMQLVLQHARGGDVRDQLSDRVVSLSPQEPLTRRLRRRLPLRHKIWEEVYELAGDVLDGFGIRYGKSQIPGVRALPGYLTKTAQCWEDLILLALRSGLSTALTVTKLSYPLGVKNSGGRVAPYRVTPDASVFQANVLVAIADAKYKLPSAQGDRESAGISASDIYEALAFLEATRLPKILLLYPHSAFGQPRLATGCSVPFERVLVGDKEIIGATVEVRGISKPGGLREFGAGIAQLVQLAP